MPLLCVLKWEKKRVRYCESEDDICCVVFSAWLETPALFKCFPGLITRCYCNGNSVFVLCQNLAEGFIRDYMVFI